MSLMPGISIAERLLNAMNAISLLFAMCLAAIAAGDDLDQKLFHSVGQYGLSSQEPTRLIEETQSVEQGPGAALGEALGPIIPGCGCAHCQGDGSIHSWVGHPYTECSSCRRDGGMWPYDYRRAFDYPWHGPNYAWGSPFVPHAWWPEVELMFGPDYPNSAHSTLGPLDGLPSTERGLLPIPSPPFPTPAERKIIRID